MNDDFKTLADLVSKTISDVRTLAGSMSPVTVERVGLAGALTLLKQKAESIYGLKTHLSIQPADGWVLPASAKATRLEAPNSRFFARKCYAAGTSGSEEFNW